jgi:hypothetical protein
VLTLLIAVVVSAVFGYVLLHAYWNEQALAEAIAETDALDPGWRLADLEANRKPVPPEKDAAPIVARMGDRIVAIRNPSLMARELGELAEALDKLRPPALPTAEQTAKLHAARTLFAPVLADAPKLLNLPEGRFPSNVKPTLNWSVRNADQANLTNGLLTNDGILRLAEGDFDGAWSDCHAMLNVARSLGDEPIWVVQAVRAHIAARAVRLMEQTLAHGVIAEARLAKTQAVLEDETQHPSILIALRGSRGVVDHSCRLLEEGRASLAEAKRMAAGSFQPLSIRDEVTDYFSRSSVKPAHAWLLRYMTQAVEIAKRPDHEAAPALVELEKTLADAPELARLLAPKLGRMAHRHPRAIQRCALAALAAERYRLTHDAWPASLDDLLAAKLLAAVPVDPFDGKALRYRALPDGVVIFSIGPDGRGDGDALNCDPPVAEHDRLEFRLWDADRRGQGR